MGVLHVYFHAADAEAALQAEATSHAGSLVGFTTVESKAADPHVALGKLVALIAGTYNLMFEECTGEIGSQGCR